MRHDPWTLLDEALCRRNQNSGPVDFWLRDDDAVEPTAALERLLSTGEEHDLPMALAVIPAHASEDLARRLSNNEHALVLQHGWAHENHARPGEKKQEFGAHRAQQAMLDEMKKGRERLERLFASRFVPVFVPPWNRIDPQLVAALPQIGLEAISTFGPEKRTAIPAVNTHVDIIDWRGSRGGRDTDTLIGEVIACLHSARAIGILTHHLVHDEAAWAFLSRLCAFVAEHPACRWRRIDALIGSDIPKPS